MRNKGLEAYIEAILHERSPKKFHAMPDETPILRAAIELRVDEAVFVAPEPQFVEQLRRRLAEEVGERDALQMADGCRPDTLKPAGRALPGRSGRPQFARPWLASTERAAAAVLLVAGTFTASVLARRYLPTPSVPRAVTATTVRSAELRTTDGRPLGRAYAYAYSGNTSWLFMDVRGGLTGAYTCELRLADGTVVPAGEVAVYNGTGDWAHTVAVHVSQLRQAALVTSSGAIVATARFR